MQEHQIAGALMAALDNECAAALGWLDARERPTTTNYLHAQEVEQLFRPCHTA